MNQPPTKEQLVSVLDNLASCMHTSAIMLLRYGRQDKAGEIEGAMEMVKEWIKNIKEEK